MTKEVATEDVEAISDRITPLAIIFMLRAQSECTEPGAMADDAVEILCHLINQLVRAAVEHGAPRDPAWWDSIPDYLADLGDRLRAERDVVAQINRTDPEFVMAIGPDSARSCLLNC